MEANMADSSNTLALQLSQLTITDIAALHDAALAVQSALIAAHN
jgi:hypothetical protein